MRVKVLLVTLRDGEDEEEVAETRAAHRRGKVVDALALEVDAEELGEEAERDVILDDVVLGERGETLGRNLHLEDEKSDSLGNLVARLDLPLVEVSENLGEEAVLEGPLEVAVALRDALDHLDNALDGVPVAELAILGVLEEVEGRALVVDVRATGLEETAEEEELKELLRVLEELEGGARLNELGYEGIGGRRSGNEGEMEEESVTEGWMSELLAQCLLTFGLKLCRCLCLTLALPDADTT